MRKASIICSILLSLFFLTEPVNAQSINLTPKWTAQAQFAGYYVADKLGFYKEEGLEPSGAYVSRNKRAHDDTDHEADTHLDRQT